MEHIDEENSIWRAAKNSWRCPGCGRSKQEVIRRAKTGRIIAKLVEHHCHGPEFVNYFVDTLGGYKAMTLEGAAFVERNVRPILRRFNDCVVCEDCNNAEAKAKKIAQCPKFFTFSPIEINTFILLSADGINDVSPYVAVGIWEEAKAQYDEMIDAAKYLITQSMEGRFVRDWRSYCNRASIQPLSVSDYNG